jgi:hypothetical protein
MNTKRKPAAPGEGQTGLITFPDDQSNSSSKKIRVSLRKAINNKCKNCIYDNLAPGTWLQQVTLCSDVSCFLYEVRPKTQSTIPESVLSYCGVKSGDYQEIAANSKGVTI